MKESQSEEKDSNEDKDKLELDKVNKHMCMKNIKRCIDKMLELFKSAWD